MKVVLCDDLPVVRDGLRVALDLATDLDVVGATDNGHDAVRLARQLRTDVIIVDVAPAGATCVEMIRQLQEELRPPPRVLVFTATEDDCKILECLDAGAMGVLVKDAGADEVAAAVRAVARGEAALAPRVARKVLDWFFGREQMPNSTEQSITSALSPREQQVLRMLTRGWTDREIARELSLDVTTIRTHNYRMRRKLQLLNRTQLVSFAYEYGIASISRARFRYGADGGIANNTPVRGS